MQYIGNAPTLLVDLAWPPTVLNIQALDNAVINIVNETAHNNIPGQQIIYRQLFSNKVRNAI